MALSAVRSGPRALPTSATWTLNTGYYQPQSPATFSVVKQIIFCNSGSAATVTFGVVASNGSSEAAANRIFNAQSIAANETITFNTNIYMSTTDRLYYYSTSASVSVTINAYEE
jgi:hypothetical protein